MIPGEISFYAFGFEKGRHLAKKMVWESQFVLDRIVSCDFLFIQPMFGLIIRDSTGHSNKTPTEYIYCSLTGGSSFLSQTTSINLPCDKYKHSQHKKNSWDGWGTPMIWGHYLPIVQWTVVSPKSLRLRHACGRVAYRGGLGKLRNP